MRKHFVAYITMRILMNALQGSFADEIKGLEDTNYILHKIAHAAAICMAATVAKSDCEAGLIGAVISGKVIFMK